MKDKIIFMEGVTKIYKAKETEVIAVKNVSFSISKGDMVSIMGPSGSGKSTILTMLGGLTHPSKGKVFIDGIDIYSLNSEKLALVRREYIGFVFQSFQLIPYLTVMENIIVPTITKTTVEKEQNERCEYYLNEVGLLDKKNRLITELSGGEQQRVAIARSLINNPLIILADEPTGNLDSKNGLIILKLFEKLNKDGKTIVIVSHNEEIKDFTKNNLIFKDGELQKTESFEIFENQR